MKKNIILISFAAVFVFGGRLVCFAGDSSVRKISLEDVRRMALENSLDIQIVKFDTYIKRTDLMRAKSIFDAFFNAGAEYRKNKLKPASSLLGTETIQETYSLELEKKFATGTTVTMGAVSEKSESDSAFSSSRPVQEAIGEISIVQELGKNFFGVIDRGGIEITKIDIENSEYTSLDDIEKALYAVQAAYWKFVLKTEELNIAEEMFAEARKLYDLYVEKEKIGLAEKGDLFAVEANLRVRENEGLQARLEKETVKNNLLFLLNESDVTIELEPLDSLSAELSYVDLYSGLKEAVNFRRDYKKIKNELKSKDIDIVVKKNALWPEIDLEASYKKNGLDGNLREAWGGLADEDSPEIFVGLTLRISVENRKARSNFDAAKLRKEQLILSFKKIERLILSDLNQSVHEVNLLKNKVELFSRIVDLQKRKLDEEIKRLKYGRSGSDVIIRYEEDLLRARVSYADALFKYRISVMDFDLDKNTLLDKDGDGKL